MTKKILLGITGCIAAYKAAELVRSLQKASSDIEIKVLMTNKAQKFIGADTFRALTGNKVSTQVFGDDISGIPHIEYVQETDLYVIAPCTANTVAKLACGIADNLVTSAALACTAPILVAPAMNVHMLENAATQKNLELLRSRGVQILEPSYGELACGENGKGRLASVQQLTDAILFTLSTGNKKDLTGKNILITAGPTQELIDPVRFLSNASSGKTGYALAACAAVRGANVTLVTGPCELEPPTGVNVIQVQSALQMYEACENPFLAADAAIFTAAVSDWRASTQSYKKIKHDELVDLHNKQAFQNVMGHSAGNAAATSNAASPVSATNFAGTNTTFNLSLKSNPDIAASLCSHKDSRFCVAFAAETENIIENAQKKLITKNVDLVVANDVGIPEQAFGCDSNKVWFVTSKTMLELKRQSKRDIAVKLLDIVAMVLNGNLA